ncbi:hypothetical protein SIO70_11730 [Chitinophaga sancti]|uniref:hypothetical protein n=1 Tax=Chitinophaga sancti TaxID=1004 RepID=UPI002A74A228|nr:hypothetical protein [Chitinophaga sancti]WPQ65518.1 hypothetical protein SIO70_11730 [Chitinophaga sancti]
MQSYHIEKINFASELDQTTQILIDIRKTSDPDVSSSYTNLKTVNVTTTGQLVTPVNFDSMLPNTDYTIRYRDTNNTVIFTEDRKSTTPIVVGDFLDKVFTIMANQQIVTSNETGLLDSYLPEKIGFLYQLKGNFRDILDQFGNFQYTVTDENIGIGFQKWDNEIGIRLTSNVTALYPDQSDSTGNNQASILGPDGTRSYSLGFWFYLTTDELAQTGVDGKLWLWYTGTPARHIGIYMDTTTKYINWVHVKDGTTESIILDHAVIANKWHRVFVRRDGSNPSDSYNNQILMKVDSGYYSPSTATYFSSSTNFAGDVNEKIYLGFGRQDSNGNLIGTSGTYKYFYYRASLTDNNLRERILNPPYPTVIIQDLDGSNSYTVPPYQFITVTNNKVSWVVPHDVPTGNKRWFYKTYSNERTPVNVTIVPFTKVSSTIDINFENESAFESNKNQLVSNFGALHKSWGGYANGGVVGDNIYFQDGKLVLECHGDNYDGNIQGVNRDGTPKVHTIQDDPIYGNDPRYGLPWVRRTGCCIVSNEYLGFGRYLIRTKIPQKLGVAPAWWTFHYEEVYSETPDYELLLAEGLKREGNFNDGYYLVRNHEIDIETPSHLVMGIFNGWLEVESNVIFFDINPQYHIGIQNDTQSSTNNGLWKYNGTGNPNLRTNWTKVSTVINPVYIPSFDNFKCNTWIGETGSGSGWRYKDSTIPDTQNDEVYLANLTPIGQFANDDAFHDYEWRWYKDRVEFYFDGVLKQTNTSFIPDIPGRLTIGPWFPSGTSSNGSYAPWLPDPTKTWAGSPADWNYQKFIVERILFEPYTDTNANGSNRLIGESYPFDGIKTITL